MAEQPPYQHRVPKAVINVLTLEPGTRVRLVGDAIAEVITNPQDGVWLLLRYLAAPGHLVCHRHGDLLCLQRPQQQVG